MSVITKLQVVATIHVYYNYTGAIEPLHVPAFCAAVNTVWVVQLAMEQSALFAIISTVYSRPAVRLNSMLVSVVVVGTTTPSSTGLPSVGMRLMVYEMLLAAQTTGGGLQLICTIPFAISNT